MQSLYKAIVIRRQMGDIKEVKMKKVPRKQVLKFNQIMQISGKNFQLYLVIIRPMQTMNVLIPGQNPQTPPNWGVGLDTRKESWWWPAKFTGRMWKFDYN